MLEHGRCVIHCIASQQSTNNLEGQEKDKPSVFLIRLLTVSMGGIVISVKFPDDDDDDDDDSGC